MKTEGHEFKILLSHFAAFGQSVFTQESDLLDNKRILNFTQMVISAASLWLLTPSRMWHLSAENTECLIVYMNWNELS